MNALVKSQIERGQKKNMKIKLEASTKLIMQLKLGLKTVIHKIDDHFEVEQPMTPADWEEKLANEEAFTSNRNRNSSKRLEESPQQRKHWIMFYARCLEMIGYSSIHSKQ